MATDLSSEPSKATLQDRTSVTTTCLRHVTVLLPWKHQFRLRAVVSGIDGEGVGDGACFSLPLQSLPLNCTSHLFIYYLGMD